MAFTIPVAHDFTSPWCWIALSQAARLQREFDVDFDWIGYECPTPALGWSEPPHPRSADANHPHTPSRLDLALAAEGLSSLPMPLPQPMRSHSAHLAVEYAKTEGKGSLMVKVLYEELYLRGSNISDPAVVEHLATGVVSDAEALRRAIREDQFKDAILSIGSASHPSGAINVPTFFIGDDRYTEQPFPVLRHAVSKAADPFPGFWRSLSFLEKPQDRPITAVVMAQTADGAISLDGKAYVGTRDDLLVMRTLEEQFDASLVGAETVRQAPWRWYSRSSRSFVLSRSGELPSDSEYAKRARIVKTSDLAEFSKHLRAKDGINTLLIEGGPSVNRQFLALGLVDELFLTISPTISMADQIKTIIGQDVEKRAPISLRLIDENRWGDELFVRYRVLKP